MKKILFVRLCITAAVLAAALLFLCGDADRNLYNISISPNEQYLYEGTPVTIDIKGLQSFNLKWEFGDGTGTRGGTKQIHTFQRPGVFNVRVYDDADPKNPAVEIKIKILKEDRELIPSPNEIITGSAVTVEARKFIDKYIRWNFGDGTGEQRGGNTVTHTYTRPGSFKIEAVDFDGKDAKEITCKIQVVPDNRSIELPAEVIEGEPFAMTVKNASGGNFVWEFSDGQKQTGPTLKSALFKNPGTFSVIVKDISGKYPPLTAQLKVVRDDRRVKVKEPFALPDETAEFSAVNFKGKTAKWDFGDGIVQNNQTVSSIIKHKFAKSGKYVVTAFDDNGNSLKTFKQEILVAELSPGFRLTHIEHAFDDGKYYKVTARNNLPPAYFVKLKAGGRGILKGKWILDGTVVGLFETILEENRTRVLEHTDVMKLPVIDHGIHRFTFEFTNYNTTMKIPVIRYFVTETGEIVITSPQPGEKLPAQPSVILKWQMKDWMSSPSVKRKDIGGLHFEIAVSGIPFQFLEDDRVQWISAGSNPEYKLDTASLKNWVYWQVRQVDRSGDVLTTSDIASFKMRGDSQDKDD
jgi:PKD repeat protein